MGTTVAPTTTTTTAAPTTTTAAPCLDAGGAAANCEPNRQAGKCATVGPKLCQKTCGLCVDPTTPKATAAPTTPTTTAAPTTTSTRVVDWNRVCSQAYVQNLYNASQVVKKTKRRLLASTAPVYSNVRSTVPAGGVAGTVLRKIMPEDLWEVQLKGGERALVKPEDMIAMTTTTTVPAATTTTTTTTTAGSSWIPLLLVALVLCIVCILAVVCCLNNQPAEKKKPKKRALQPEPVVEAPAPAPKVVQAQWLTAPILSVSAPPPVTTHVVQPVMQQPSQVIQYAAPAVQYATAPQQVYASPPAASMVLQQPVATYPAGGSMVGTEPVAGGRHFG